MAVCLVGLSMRAIAATTGLTTETLEAPLLETVPIEEPIEVEEPVDDDIEEQEAVPRSYAPLRSPTACPETVEPLTALLIRDIPNYTNRVLQRTVAALPNDNVFGREPYRPSFVLIAGQLELAPLDLNEYTFTSDPEAGGPLTQVFFTTLSRQYFGLRDTQVQQYHWLFLTRAADGWRLAFMFSAIDDVEGVRSPLPPRESSDGSVGQAVQLWLRDCRAGAIEALEDDL
ncbi:MAG: hypothetical protein WA885_21885 [Phormidesmis sp.]